MMSHVNCVARRGSVNSSEGKMLEREHKAELNRALLKIANILNDLENTPVDPRIYDLLEISASLIQQQIEQNIKYEIIDDEIVFEDGNIPASSLIDSEEINQQFGSEPTREYDSTGFRFLESDDDIPTVEDLQRQWDIPWPFNP